MECVLYVINGEHTKEQTVVRERRKKSEHTKSQEEKPKTKQPFEIHIGIFSFRLGEINRKSIACFFENL